MFCQKVQTEMLSAIQEAQQRAVLYQQQAVASQQQAAAAQLRAADLQQRAIDDGLHLSLNSEHCSDGSCQRS
jgi:hypothetical protein